MFSQTPLRRKGPGLFCFPQEAHGTGPRGLRPGRWWSKCSTQLRQSPSNNTQKALCWIQPAASTLQMNYLGKRVGCDLPLVDDFLLF